MSCLIPVLVSNTITTISTEAQVICYHQYNTCGIIFGCDETRQKCGLPFYNNNNNNKCSLCASRSPLFQRPLKSITYF